MQTSFTDAQLQDPAIAESARELRACVHCGMCTATCPTFAVLGDELDSPRGRIYLIKKMLEDGGPADATVTRHVDRCLSCLSCMTTCPSGVNYMRLIDQARAHIEANALRPWHDRALRALLAAILTRPALFRASLRAARPLRPLARLLPRQGHALAARLRAMSDLVPQHLADGVAPGVYPAATTRRARVALLRGCAQSVVAPHITRASISLLTRLGVEVVLAQDAGCCGALPLHMGRRAQARDLASRNIAAWSALRAQGGLDAIITDTSGCGTTMKDYGHLFGPSTQDADDAAHGAGAAQAAGIAALVVDITEFLERFGYAPSRPNPGLRVAYHPACSLQHGQRVLDAPKQLLRAAGFCVLTPREAHLCCGSAGTYNLLQPEISQQLRSRKLTQLGALDADIIAAGNVGCLTQLAGDRLPVCHTVELLDWMAGGAAPAGLPLPPA